MYTLLLYASQLSGRGVWGKTGGWVGGCGTWDVAGLWEKMRTAGQSCMSRDAAASPRVTSQVYSLVQGTFTT